MEIIQNSNASSTKVVSLEEVNGTDAKPSILSLKNSAKISSAHKDALIAEVAKQPASAPKNMAGAPSLSQPDVDIDDIDEAQCAALASALCAIRDDPALESRIAEIQTNPAFVQKMDSLRTQATALSGDAPRSDAAGFNIMTISSQPTDLLIAFLLLMLQSRVTEAKFNSAMTLNNAAAVAKSADFIRHEGVTQTATGVVSGVLGIGLGVGGAGFKATAQYKNRLNQKNVITPMKDRQAESKTVNESLNSAKGSAKSADELKSLDVKEADGTVKTIRVAPSDTELSPDNNAKISNTINARKQILDRGDALANAANQKTIDNLNTTGDLLVAGSGIGGVLNAGVQVSTAADRAQQKTSDLDSRVAGQGADDAREKGKALIALVNEMLQSMVAVNQSRNATFAAVAGNIRG